MKLLWNETGSVAADPFDLHSETSNPERITVKQGGYYYAHAAISWTANNGGARGVQIRQDFGNGAAEIYTVQAGPAAPTFGTHQSGGRLLRMEAGDVVEVLAVQTSSGALVVTPQQFSVHYVGPLA